MSDAITAHGRHPVSGAQPLASTFFATVIWAITLTIALALVATIIGVPLAQAHGHPEIASRLYKAFSFVCHQIPERSFHLSGQKLGVCSRCTGIYGGFAVAVLVYPMVRSLKHADTPSRVWLILAALPLGVDFALTYSSIWDNTQLSRLVTGALLSSVAVFFIMPGLVELSQAKWLRSLFRKPARRFYSGRKAKDLRKGGNLSQLVGKPVSLMISDPWDFGTECGVGPFYGKVTDSGTEKIADEDVQRALVTLDRSILYSNTNYLFAICHVRHEGASLEDLEAGSKVSVNITLLPKEARTLNDIDDEDFRRGFAATGSLQPV